MKADSRLPPGCREKYFWDRGMFLLGWVEKEEEEEPSETCDERHVRRRWRRFPNTYRLSEASSSQAASDTGVAANQDLSGSAVVGQVVFAGVGHCLGKKVRGHS